MSDKYVTVGIYLGAKDEDLKRWYHLLKQNNLEQSFFIRQAILAHISGEKISLGKVCKKKGQETIRTSYTLTSSDVEIVQLFKSLEQANIKVSSYLKQILKSCITLVAKERDEFIPSYFDFNVRDFAFSLELLAPTPVKEKVIVPEEPIAPSVVESKTVQQKEVAPTNNTQLTPTSTKKTKQINPYISAYV